MAIPTFLGKKLLLDRKPYLVIGVMPAGFEFPLRPGHLDQSELWIPMSFEPEQLTTGASSWQYEMVGPAEARGVDRASEERCGARGRGDHAELSGVHEQHSHYCERGAAARRDGDAMRGRWWGRCFWRSAWCC